MTNRAKIWQRVLLALLMAAAVFVGWRYPPPAPLVEWAGGQGFWPRAALAVATYFVFIAVFIPFGVFDALELTLPFGLAVKRHGQESTEPADTSQTAFAQLQRVLTELRGTTDRAFSDMEAISGQLQESLEKIDDHDRRIGVLEAQATRMAREPGQRVIDLGDQPPG
jgi:hypothetical protein